MEPAERNLTNHAAHPMRGPHFRRRLTSEQRDALHRWLEKTEQDARIGVRELADFISELPPVQEAVFRTVQSASFGGVHVSSPTHAVALLGIRRTRQMLRRFDNLPHSVPPTSPRG